MNTATNSDFNNLLCRAVEQLGTESFYPTLLSWLNANCPCDSHVVLYYAVDHRPQIVFDGTHPIERDSLYKPYMNGAYLLSPLYQKFLQKKFGAYWHNDLAPDGFTYSEYYRQYYSLTGLNDEYNFLFPFDQGGINISCARTHAYSQFTDEERQRYEELYPFISSLCQQHHKQLQPSRFADKLDSALDAFGRDVLTDREREIMHLILKGHSSKSTAKILDISPGTVRIHRNNLYGKLGISSQSELFNLVLSALAETT